MFEHNVVGARLHVSYIQVCTYKYLGFKTYSPCKRSTCRVQEGWRHRLAGYDFTYQLIYTDSLSHNYIAVNVNVLQLLFTLILLTPLVTDGDIVIGVLQIHGAYLICIYSAYIKGALKFSKNWLALNL